MLYVLVLNRYYCPDKTVKGLLQNTLVRVFLSTGLTTGIKVLSAVILSKIIALKLGPAGLAMIGQLSNFMAIALTLSTGGFANGIIKFVAAAKTEQARAAFVRQSLKLTAITAFIVSVLVLLGSHLLSILFFKTAAYQYIFLLAGTTLVFYAMHNYFLSFLNGLSAYKTYNWVNGLTSLGNVGISVALIFAFGLQGALSAIAINQTVSCIISFGFVRPYLPSIKKFLSVSITGDVAGKLFSFSLMAFTTAAIVPATQIVIRNMIIRHQGIDDAGEWEAINRISLLYLSVLTNVMMVYYLPRLSSLQTHAEVRHEVRRGFVFFMPVIFLLVACLYLLRNVIIMVIFSRQFSDVSSFFLPQITGDFFKILSYIFGFLVIAKSKTSFFIFSETTAALLYILSAGFFVEKYGTIGAVYAYTLTYVLYFVLQTIYYKKWFKI